MSAHVGSGKMKFVQAGFTLVQMSVLVTVLGLATAAAIPGGKKGQPVERQLTTEERLDRVQKAMTGYKASFGALPCPADARLAQTDTNFGLAAANSGTCVGGTPSASLNNLSAVVGGMIPTRTLGIEDQYAYDAYGRRITYIVDSRATNPTSCLSLTQATAALQIQDETAAVTNTYAAYISHGASGYGAYPANGATTPLLPSSTAAAALDAGKLENASVTNAGVANFDAVFVKKEKSGSFDDIVRQENTCCTGSSCDVPPYDGPELIWGGYSCDWGPPGYGWGPTNGAQPFEKINGQFSIITPRLPPVFRGVNMASLSPDNTYLVVGGYLTTNAGQADFTILKRSGKTFTVVQNALINNAFATPGGAGVLGWTPDSKYLFTTHGCCAGQMVGVWQRNGDTFTYVSTPDGAFPPYVPWQSLMSSGYVYSIAFTKTSSEMVLRAYANTGGYGITGLYRYNPSAPTIATAFTQTKQWLGGIISPDGNYVMSPGGYNCPAGACGAVKMYKRRSGTNEFDFKDEKPTRISYLGQGYWSPDNQYYSQAGSYGTVPFEVYKLVANDKMERMENFDFYPSTGSGYGSGTAPWSSDGQFIAGGGYDYSCANRSAYVYRKYGDNFYFQQFLNFGTNPYTGNVDGYAHSWSLDFRH